MVVDLNLVKSGKGGVIMNTFQRLVSEDLKCEVCGSVTIPLYGCGWDNDRILCSDPECGAEYVFPTSTTLSDD
jgi:hypothetical protein